MTVYIEGNIGSGKSTLTPILADALKAEFILEPVSVWEEVKDSNGTSILDKFYSSMERYAYAFQSFAFLSRLQMLNNINETQLTLVERSIYADRNVFAENCYEDTILDPLEWQVYEKWFDWCEHRVPCHVRDDQAIFLYLRTDPAICMDRIRERGRPAEEHIKLDYLERLHKKHEEWLCSNDRLNVVIIDGNCDADVVVTNAISALQSYADVTNALTASRSYSEGDQERDISDRCTDTI